MRCLQDDRLMGLKPIRWVWHVPMPTWLWPNAKTQLLRSRAITKAPIRDLTRIRLRAM